jgi:peptidoglycan/LPS O-acetylase OafA/YrhL
MPGTDTKAAAGEHNIAVLDGVRAVSILMVLAGHLLPLGPKALQLNALSASMGMSLFFILSGFLITRTLLDNKSLSEFLIKRLFRIIPLAYLFMLVVFILFDHDIHALINELAFTLNYNTGSINNFNGHLWSLCVEVQFYAIIGLLFRLARKAAPYLVLGLCLVVTTLKIMAHAQYSMQTHLRGDELLAGSLLCLSLNGTFGDHGRFWRMAERFTPALFVLAALTCQPDMGALDYGRAYAAALLVGSVVFTRREWLSRALCSRPMGYLARVSYAIYVIHVGMIGAVAAVLGAPSKIALYLIQRPITIVASFALAHLSTFHYEAHWIALGRKLIRTRRRQRRQDSPIPVTP